MRNILNIIVHDFRRLTASVVTMVILMGIIVVPCLFAWLNILSNDDPFEPQATGRIPVAVANEDEGADMLGLNINVGEKFIDAINGNDMIGWDVVSSKKKAVDGVYGGDYYAAIVIPEDFSEKMMSFTSGNLEHPKVLFYENQKTNAIAPKITGKVREVLEEEIDATFVDTLGQYITEAANAAEAAGFDPQDTFSDLSSRMDELSADLESSVAMARAFYGLSGAAGDLLKASEDLIDSSEDTLDLGEALLESADSKMPEEIDTSSAEKVIHELNTLLTKDLSAIDRDLSAAGDDMGKFNSFVQNKLENYKTTAGSMKSSVDKIAKELDSMGLTGLASRFSRVSDKLQDMIDKLNNLETADASNWSLMQGFIDDILTDVSDAEKTIAGIDADVDGTVDKKFNQAVKDARAAISKTRKSLGGIYGDMDLLDSTLNRSEKSLKSLESGLDQTVATLVSLQQGCRNLSDLFNSFSDSDMLKDINHLMTNDAAVIAKNLAAPIKMKTEEVYPIRNFGSVMAPFYNVIAQWIGALFAAVMIHVQVRRRDGLEKMRLHEAFIGRYRLFLGIGLIQALLLSLGELLYVGIQCVHPLLFILCSCVNGLVFTLIVYSLVFALENLGLAVSVIVMILQVAGGGGSFPVEVLPRPFQIMFPFMPFRYAMDALRECIGGTYGATWAKCLGILLLMSAAAIAFGLLLHKPMTGIIEKIEKSKRESDVML
ncbi:MAG: YhgE/Pip domain-containing protein [Firmicutes bacterium]|nr:YhgE/Pip domain-containing protein [Bacillota bacterium]